MGREGRSVLGGLAVLAVLTAFVVSRIEVETDIGHFLPGGGKQVEVTLAKELSLGELSRALVLLIEANDTETALAAGHRFEDEMRREPRVTEHLAFLEGGPAQGLEEALWDLYQPRRFAFFAEDVETATALLEPDSLREAAVHLKKQLALPISTLVSRVAPEDPTLILPKLFKRLAGRGEGLHIEQQRFVTEDGKATILFAGTQASAAPARAQRSFQEGILSAFEKTRAATAGEVRLLQSGAGRFALRAEESMKADVRRVSIGSMLGLSLFFLVLFRSLRLVLMVLPVIGAGFLVGTSACLHLFGSIHGITLAFGAAMIGVSIDYGIHFHGHWMLAPAAGGPRATLASIWKGLFLSAATTVTGFLALAASNFPGLRQLAVFAACGVAAALIASRIFLPSMAGASCATPLARALATRLGQLVRGGNRWVLATPVLLVVALTLIGLPRLQWNDNIADLNRLDPELLAEDEAVRARVVRYEQRRLIVALGATEEDALVANDRIALALDVAENEGAIRGSRSLATLLPSAHRQRTVDAAVRNDTQLWPKLEVALAAEGFRTESFAGFREALTQPGPEPLRYADLLASPLASIARPHRVTFDDVDGASFGFVSFLHGIEDEARLRELLQPIGGAHLIDIQQTLTDAYGAFRQRMQGLLLWGLAAVLALVLLRHRALRPSLTAYAPAILAAAGTLALLSLLGIGLNMLSLVALLMVVSMGVDYGVLLAESQNDERSLDATLFAVVVAAISTVLGFGLLAFSRQPALNSIGWAAGIGVLLCLVLAPALCGLARGRVAPLEEVARPAEAATKGAKAGHRSRPSA